MDEVLIAALDHGTRYYHEDRLGSGVTISNDQGQPIKSYTYDVFGASTIIDPDTHATPTDSLQCCYDTSWVLRECDIDKNNPEQSFGAYVLEVFSPF